jgi:hypothetical protein
MKINNFTLRTCWERVLEYFIQINNNVLVTTLILIPYFEASSALALRGRNFLNKSADIIL